MPHGLQLTLRRVPGDPECNFFPVRRRQGHRSRFSKKVASSTDDEMVEAKYIGANDESEATDSFDIEVRSLAEPQVNQSNFYTAVCVTSLSEIIRLT